MLHGGLYHDNDGGADDASDLVLREDDGDGVVFFSWNLGGGDIITGDDEFHCGSCDDNDSLGLLLAAKVKLY